MTELKIKTHRHHLMWNCYIKTKSVCVTSESDLRSFGMLYGVHWYLVTDISGQPIAPIFNGQAVEAEFLRRLDP